MIDARRSMFVPEQNNAEHHLQVNPQVFDGQLSQTGSAVSIGAALPDTALALHLAGCLLQLPLALLQLPLQPGTRCLLRLQLGF